MIISISISIIIQSLHHMNLALLVQEWFVKANVGKIALPDTPEFYHFTNHNPDNPSQSLVHLSFFMMPTISHNPQIHDQDDNHFHESESDDMVISIFKSPQDFHNHALVMLMTLTKA